MAHSNKKGFKALRYEIKSLKAQLENKTSAFLTQKALATHYHELSDCGIGELKFKNMKVEYLLSVIDEVEAMAEDELVSAVIENAKNRNNLDTLIHTRKIFGKNPQTL